MWIMFLISFERLSASYIHADDLSRTRNKRASGQSPYYSSGPISSHLTIPNKAVRKICIWAYAWTYSPVLTIACFFRMYYVRGVTSSIILIIVLKRSWHYIITFYTFDIRGFIIDGRLCFETSFWTAIGWSRLYPHKTLLIVSYSDGSVTSKLSTTAHIPHMFLLGPV